MIEFAIKQARLNPIKPTGRNSISRFAAILSNGKQTFIGFNQYKTHPLQAKFGINDESIYLHAELNAIIKAINWRARQKGVSYGKKEICDLSDYQMVIARVLRNGNPGCAKPCSGCFEAIKHFNISKIEWSE